MTEKAKACKQNDIFDVSPDLVESWLLNHRAILIDVREDFEYAQERIGTASHCPLSSVDPVEIRKSFPGQKIVFHCRTGIRSRKAAELMSIEGEAFHLEGGIELWKSSGRSVINPKSLPKLDIMRQVQIIAGTLVLVGVVLGVTVNAAFLGICVVVGSGLLFAGVSGWCGMAKLLAKLPWN